MRDENKSAAMKLTICRILVYIMLIFLTILCLFPFYLLIVNASRSNGELQAGFTLFPSSHFLENFISAWNDASVSIPRGMLNSFIVASITAVLTTYFSALTAYGLYAYKFRLKKVAFTFIMAVLVIPKQVSAVGFVQMVNKLGLNNNYLPLIIPGIAAPIVFFYMKQYMESVLPLEVIESARIDGSGEYSTFNKIVLPMISPALAVQGIFSFVEAWNNYFIPSLILTKAEYKTVPLMIAQLRSADYANFDLGRIYMFILLAIVPVLIVYMFVSKKIVSGVTAGSVKG